jgi:hypothetical protein
MLIGLMFILVVPLGFSQGAPALQETGIVLQSGEWTTGVVDMELTGDDKSDTFELNFTVDETGTILMGTVSHTVVNSNDFVFLNAGSWVSVIDNDTLLGSFIYPFSGNSGYVNYGIMSWVAVITNSNRIEGIAVISNPKYSEIHEVQWVAEPST